MSCCHTWVRVMEVVGAVLVSVLAAGAAVMGAIPFTQCNHHSFLDWWLVVFGVTAAAVVIGVAIWRSEARICSYINGPKYLLIILLTLNIIWLVVGNIIVALYYEACASLPDDLVADAFDVTCSFYQLPFTLAVVLIADIIYIIILFTFCCKGECCNDCHCICCKKSAWSIYWALVLGILSFLLLSIVAIGIGASYFEECAEEDWAAILLIVLGTVGVVSVCVGVCWLRCKSRLADSWVTPSLVLPLPLIVILVVLFAIVTVGNVWLLETRNEACRVENYEPCNTALQAFTIVAIILLNFPIFVLFYVGAVLFLLIIFLMFLSCCLYCANDHRCRDEEACCKLKE